MRTLLPYAVQCILKLVLYVLIAYELTEGGVGNTKLAPALIMMKKAAAVLSVRRTPTGQGVLAV